MLWAAALVEGTDDRVLGLEVSLRLERRIRSMGRCQPPDSPGPGNRKRKLPPMAGGHAVPGFYGVDFPTILLSGKTGNGAAGRHPVL